jgi:hypothetical protein
MGIPDFCMARTRSPTTGFSIIGRVNSGEVTGTMSLRNRNASHLFDLYCLESLGPCSRANTIAPPTPRPPDSIPSFQEFVMAGVFKHGLAQRLRPNLLIQAREE